MSAPLDDAAVWIEDGTIRWVGKKKDLPAEAKQEKTIDLGDSVLAPGLVNAHAHLELTALAGFAYPGSFVGWIREVLRKKNELSAEQQTQSMRTGIAQVLRGGTTTVGDHISVTGDLETLLRSPLRGKAFVEIIGVVPEVAEDIRQAAFSLKKAYENFPSLIEIIPSPHSIHALDREVLQKVLREPSQPFSIHLCESEAEDQYFREGTGELFHFISQRGSPPETRASSAILELGNLKQLDSRILAIHANYLNDGEIRFLSENQISVVHCPLSHRYFGHSSFVMESLLKSGINIGLGTDSLSSASSLSMLDVMRATQEAFPKLTQEIIFRMATMGGAKALKMESEIGEITEGKKADLLAVPRTGNAPLEALFHADQVHFLMIAGKAIDLSSQ